MVGTMWGKGRTYDEFTVGEKFRFRLPTVTEAYVNNFCCLTGDFTFDGLLPTAEQCGNGASPTRRNGLRVDPPFGAPI